MVVIQKKILVAKRVLQIQKRWIVAKMIIIQKIKKVMAAMESANTSPSGAPPEAAVVCLVPSSKIIPLADTLPLTPIPPTTCIEPVAFDVDANEACAIKAPLAAN